jgi:hypothetical protein
MLVIKMLPRLTTPNLAGWYLLRHAGFARNNEYLQMPSGVEKMQKPHSALPALPRSLARAAFARPAPCGYL